MNAIGDIAYSKRPLLIIPKVQLRLRVTHRSATALAHYLQKLAKLFVGKNFVKILVTAQMQLRSYSEQQRAFGNSNICNWISGALFSILCFCQVVDIHWLCSDFCVLSEMYPTQYLLMLKLQISSKSYFYKNRCHMNQQYIS